MGNGHRFSGWREYAVHALFMLVILAIAFPYVFLYGHMISPFYVLLDFLPWKLYASNQNFPHCQALVTWEFLGQFTGWSAVMKRALADGEWPLWNPFMFTGLPLMANYQSAIFYPPRLLHALLDIHTANTLYVLLKIWLCGFTAYVYGRGIGLSVVASRFLSVGFALCLYVMTWTFWAQPDVVAWLPLLFLSADNLIDCRYRRGFSLMLVSATLMLLAGHPESAFTTAGGVGVYFVLRLIAVRRLSVAAAKALGLAAAAWALALAISSVQILPFLEYLPNSYKLVERADEAAAKYSLSPMAAIGFWVPRFFGVTKTATENYWGTWIHSGYSGILYPGLAVWLGIVLLFTRSGKKGTLVRPLCLTVPTVFCLMMVFNHSLLQPLRQVPPFAMMWNIWFFAFPAFTLPLLGAMGMERWFARPRGIIETVPAILVALVVGAAAYGLYRFNHGYLTLQGKGMDAYVWRQLLIAAAFAIATLLPLIGSVLYVRPGFWAVVLTVVLTADLAVAGRGLRPTIPRDHLYPETKLTRWLENVNPPPRCALGSKTSATIPDGVMQYYGIEDFLGFDGMYPRRILELRKEVNLWNSMAPIFSIRYYLHLPALKPFFPRDERGGFALADTVDGLEIYEDTWACKRALLVGQAQVVPDKDEMFGIMNDPEYNPRRVALVESPLPEALPDAAPENVGDARFVKRTNNTATVEVDAKQRSILVLADQWFPGWTAVVDDTPAKVFPVYYVFRGVVVEPGKHTVTFHYEPASFRIGLTLAVVVLVGNVAGALIYLVRRRRGAALLRTT